MQRCATCSLPSADVGCVFARDALEHVSAGGDRPFDAASLTENHELGFRLRDRRRRSLRDAWGTASVCLPNGGSGSTLETVPSSSAAMAACTTSGYPRASSSMGLTRAGVAGVHSRRWFGDAQARVTKRGESYPGISLGAGGGNLASAQYGTRRVETGPLIEMRVRGGTTPARIA